MNNKPSVILLIPCYNEELSIGTLLSEIHQECPDWQPVVINDGSTDRTAEIVSSFSNVVLLDLPVNLGVGGAIQTGLKFARNSGADYAVKIDGDGQHPPCQIHNLLNAFARETSDIVVGSRFINKEGFKSSFARRQGIHILQILCRLLTGMQISDPTSGFRAYNRKAIDFFADFYPSFDYPEPEEVILARKNGLQLSETAVEMRMRKSGVSSISSSVSIYYMLKVTLSMLFIYLREKESKAPKGNSC
ncbi:MAG: glycosyltransferase family 2 protein [Candidatus Rifleibacteriota bacterium]